jgi:hypothetical protein
MPANSGTYVIYEITTPDTLDEYPTHLSNLGRGGLMASATTATRDLITFLRRQEGLACYVAADQKVYILTGGTANTNWLEFVGGGTASLLDYFYLPGRVGGQIGYGGISIGDDLILYAAQTSLNRGEGGEVDIYGQNGVGYGIGYAGYIGGKVLLQGGIGGSIVGGGLEGNGGYGGNIELIGGKGGDYQGAMPGGKGGSILLTVGDGGSGGVMGNRGAIITDTDYIVPEVDNTTDLGSLNFGGLAVRRYQDIYLAGSAYIDTSLKILESGATPTKYTIFQGGDQIIDVTYTLPTAYPTQDGYALTATSAGTMSWAASGISATHNLMSATHSDTVVGSPNIGTLAVGVAGPPAAWEILSPNNTSPGRKYLSSAFSGVTPLPLGWVRVDHSLDLESLDHDDHTQYLLLSGRTGGQSVVGGIESGDLLTFKATTDGTSYVLNLGKNSLYPAVTNKIDFGDSTHSFKDIYVGTLRILESGATPTKYTIFQGGDQTADLTYTLPTTQPGSSLVGPTAGNFLYSDTNGVLSWIVPTFTEVDTLETVTSRGALSTYLCQFQNAGGIELGKDAATNVTGVLKMWSAGVNSYYNTFTAGENSANANYTLPIAMPSISGYILSSTSAGVMSWIAQSSGVTAHNLLSNLNWSAAGHTFDADLDTGAYDFATTGEARLGAGAILGIDAATNTAGYIKLFSAGNNNYYTTITAATQSENVAYVLPTAQGVANTLLKNDGSGNLSWATVAADKTQLFGDGSDGDVTINTATVLARDMYYDDLTIDTDVLLTYGFKIFVKGTLNIHSTGSISAAGSAGGNGGDASGWGGGSAGGAGSAPSSGSIPGGLAGVDGKKGGDGNQTQGIGGDGSNGIAGKAETNSANGVASYAGASGGAGGQVPNYTGGGGGGGGLAGTVAPVNAGGGGPLLWNQSNLTLWRYNIYNTAGSSMYPFNFNSGSPSGGSGGGGAKNMNGIPGAGGGGGGSGGSGSNGGCIYIAANIIINSGTISAAGGVGGNGGNGADSTPMDDTGGGGGGAGGNGGAGGIIALIYNSLTNTGTISVAGGSGGTEGSFGFGFGAGNGGYNGSPGTVGKNGKIVYLN